jgi:hypothetical protein
MDFFLFSCFASNDYSSIKILWWERNFNWDGIDWECYKPHYWDLIWRWKQWLEWTLQYYIDFLNNCCNYSTIYYHEKWEKKKINKVCHWSKHLMACGFDIFWTEARNIISVYLMKPSIFCSIWKNISWNFFWIFLLFL